ncbi:uncharacterized protein LOC111406529 [Olea europaea var. sylvestris]|uniref:uncharacterized protein LOC111406529 n=1 Tax=Olea europaea var. sylvestris TaxID=158386 RepID=UPI000C1CEDF6|nr:uncharacterized protein LOC111406529 [Olea europaea var. sylvestris]
MIFLYHNELNVLVIALYNFDQLAYIGDFLFSSCGITASLSYLLTMSNIELFLTDVYELRIYCFTLLADKAGNHPMYRTIVNASPKQEFQVDHHTFDPFLRTVVGICDYLLPRYCITFVVYAGSLIIIMKYTMDQSIKLSRMVLLLGVGIATVTVLQLNILGSALSLLAVVTTFKFIEGMLVKNRKSDQDDCSSFQDKKLLQF